MSATTFFYPRADSRLLANVPHALTEFKSWIVWMEAPSGANPKFKKLPLAPLSLSGSDWNNPTHWSHRATATQVFEENPTMRGIGFVFSAADPYCFFDLDNVIVRGKLLPWAAEFVAMANSYAEVSASNGIKVIVRADLGTRKKSFEFKDSSGNPHEIEVYDRDRFFAATGNRYEGTPRDIRDGQELLDTLHPPREEEETATASFDRSKDSHAALVDEIPDDDLIDKILASKSQGPKFRRLMNGDSKGYAGWFAASGALCAILAYWTRCNPERIERIYRRSKFYTPDWWEDTCYSGKKSRKQYVIEEVCRLQSSREMYTPPAAGFLTNDDGKVRAILANAITILKTTPAWNDVLAVNKLTMTITKRRPAPWGKEGDWSDFDSAKLVEWLERHGLMIDSPSQAFEAARAVAEENAFHPVLDYLNGLAWDKTPRLARWTVTYLGCEDTEYIREAGKCWMISAVARMFQPGCQADYTLILEGATGIQKTKALEALASTAFFDGDITELNGKDVLMKIHRVWIACLAELAGVRRSDVEKVKSFLTNRVDHFRLPYGRCTISVPRTNVFAADTNNASPFMDETGNRRFWPIRCGVIDLEALKRDRDQLWGEAVELYNAGVPWYFTTKELNDAATEEQDHRYQRGVWDSEIEKFLEAPAPGPQNDYLPATWESSQNFVTIPDILTHVIGKPLAQRTRADEMAVAKCLIHNHWRRTRGEVKGRRIWGYTRGWKP